MKILIRLSILASIGLPPAVDAQTTYPCPSAGSSTILPITAISTATVIRVPVVSNPAGLCLLSRRSSSSGKQRTPVARSYAGRGTWEQSPGLFAKTGSGVEVDCSGGDVNECEVTLPGLEAGMEYVLESYEYETSMDAEAARFLEQATFGPTLEAINTLSTTNSNDFASWISNQFSLPTSSHREFFRQRVNPKYEFPYIVGATGPRPCELHSRWRRYAITSRDQLRNRKTFWYKHLTVELIDGVYVWKVDGYFRTVTAEHPTFVEDGSSVVLGARYRLTHQNGYTWMADCVGCDIDVEYNGQDNTLANPLVSITGIESNPAILPYNIVSLPDFKSNSFPTMESSTDYPLFDDWIHPYEHALLNTTSLEGTTECDGFPTFRQPVALDGADSAPGTFPAMFGRSVDVDSGEEVVFAYDPHLALYENAVENPLPDGGGQLVIDTTDLVAGVQVSCQNAPRSFLNADGCKLSYEPNVCSPSQAEPTKVIVMDEPALAGINGMVTGGEKLYAVTGLEISNEVDAADNPYLSSPCSGSESRSRWVKDESDTTCANTAGLGAQTIQTFSDLISAKETTTESFNANVASVHREIRTCDAGDASKLELGRVKSGDGSCWVHVHPAEYSVIDLANADASKYSIAGSASVTFTSANMGYFYDTVNDDGATFPVIGVLGDHVELDDSEPSPLDQQDIQDVYKTLEYNPSLGPVLVCGSPNEVASDPFYGEHGFDVTTPENQVSFRDRFGTHGA